MPIQDDLARIRERAGLEPIPDGRTIQGFGPNDAPPPPFATRSEAPPGWLDDDPDEAYEDVEPAPSPLIPRKPPVIHMPTPPVTAALQQVFGLMVADKMAAWKNREVTLSESDEKAIRAIVLRAIQREVDAELSAVTTKRRRFVRAEAPIPESKLVGDRPRRGRPKKAID